MYTIIPSPQFRRSYRKLSRQIQNQVDKAANLLSDNPLHPSLRTHKRKGDSDIWQARVTLSHRLFFHLEGNNITLIDVVPHEK